MQEEDTYKDNGWDFNSIWGINDGEFPHLQELSSDGPINPKSIEKIETKDIYVKVGTKFEDVPLKNSLKATLHDGTTGKVKANDWEDISNGRKYHNGNVAESYFFESEVTFDSPITNPHEEAASTKVIVKPFYIESVSPEIFNIDTHIGTELSELDLPEKVMVEVDEGDDWEVDVDWDNADPHYDPNVPREYIFTGELDSSRNELTNENNVEATARVTLKPFSINSIITDIPNIETDVGTEISDLDLPETVKVKDDVGKEWEVDVDWDDANPNYDANVPREYAFTGELHPSSDKLKNNNNIDANVLVTIKPEMEVEIPLDDEVNVYANQIGKIDGTVNKLIMPSDLPLGTTVIVSDISGDNEVTNEELLLLAGGVYDFEFNYPSNEEPKGNFELTMSYDPNLDGEVDIYYYDEDNAKWIAQNGTVDKDNHTITIYPDHFSKYGVFAPKPEDDKGTSNGDGKLGDNGTDPCKSQDPIAAGCEDFDDDKVTTTLGDDSTDGKKLPKTATNSYNMLLIGFGLLLAGGITYFIRSKRMN